MSSSENFIQSANKRHRTALLFLVVQIFDPYKAMQKSFVADSILMFVFFCFFFFHF